MRRRRFWNAIAVTLLALVRRETLPPRADWPRFALFGLIAGRSTQLREHATEGAFERLGGVRRDDLEVQSLAG